MPHKKDCGHCEKNYTGECRPVDVKDCIKHGRHTKFKQSEIHRRMGHCKKILDAESDQGFDGELWAIETVLKVLEDRA